MILLVGSPRSGTTWLAKIFDSHPRVLYRHEPDTVDRGHELPIYCEGEKIEQNLDTARAYLDRLVRVRNTKSTGSLPIFPKTYLAGPSLALRKAMIVAAKAGERLPLVGDGFRRLDLPDMADPTAPDIEIAIKSIGALGRVRLFLRARPDTRAIVIVRHPCGHVSSVLRGIARNMFDDNKPATEARGIYEDLATTEPAKRRGLDADAFMAMTPEARLTWRWAIPNELAMAAADDAAGRVRVVRYEDVCRAPEALARELFEFAGLDWQDQTAGFVGASTAGGDGNESYYQLFRDPLKSAMKWQQELSDEQQAAILAVAAETAPGRLFTEAA
ncbi:MAG: sulfotransferase [Alphaproteobacteria bacterium]